MSPLPPGSLWHVSSGLAFMAGRVRQPARLKGCD